MKPGNTSLKPRCVVFAGMTDYLISAILFVAIVTMLIYLWKREHP